MNLDKIASRIAKEEIVVSSLIAKWQDKGRVKGDKRKWIDNETGEIRFQIIKPRTKSTKKKQTQTKKNTNKSLFSKDEVSSLPVKANQPNVKTKEDLYKQATEAQEQMLDWLDRDKGLGPKLGLKHIDMTKEKPNAYYDKPGPLLITAPLKKEKRATEKVQADYDGDWSRLTDVVRASIAFDSMEELQETMKKLKKSGLKLAKKPKDRFSKPTSAGYRDLMMNVTYPNGHIGELQVHVKPMLVAKSKAHKEYEKVRSIEAKAKKEKRTEMTDEEFAEVERATKVMKDIYDGAWEQVMSENKRKKAMDRTALREFYFVFEGNPARFRFKFFPQQLVGGKWKTIYDIFKFVHEAEKISKKEFNNLVNGK